MWSRVAVELAPWYIRGRADDQTTSLTLSSTGVAVLLRLGIWTVIDQRHDKAVRKLPNPLRGHRQLARQMETVDDLADIREMYNAAWDVEDTRLERHKLEADLTWRYLARYLPPAGRLLEIGCGTGAYTFPLAERGYRITAVDLAEGLLVRCKAQAAQLGLGDRIHFRVGDARNLEEVPYGAFDAVLLMGPLYHLVLEADRAAALRSAYRCLRQGGVIFSALISRFGVLADHLKKNPSWIENQEWVRSVMERGHRPDDAPRGGFRGYFVRPEEVAPMHEAVGFHTVGVAGVEPIVSAHDEVYNNLSEERRTQWLDLLFEVSTEPSIIGLSVHLLYVGCRES